MEVVTGFRVCYANSLSNIQVKILPNSKYFVTASRPTKVKDVKNILSIVPNVTEFVVLPEVNDCIGRLVDNQSDIAAGSLAVSQSGIMYQVPVPWTATTLFIVSGYNQTEYQLEQSSRGRSFLGVLTNLGNFDASVYLIALTMLLCCILVLTLSAFVWREKLLLVDILCKRNPRVTSLTKGLFNRASRNRMNLLLLSVATFLIFAPFKCMYKTTQIVSDHPPLIKTYREILDRNISVRYSNAFANVPGLSLPSRESVKKKDLVYRFYNHLIKRRYKDSTPMKSKKDVWRLSMERRKLVFRQKLVYIGDEILSDRILVISCTMTLKGSFHRYFKFHDPNQREEFTGYAVRLGVKSHKLNKNMRRALERGTVYIRESRLTRYLYKDFKYNEGTLEEYRKQRRLCYQEHLTQDNVQNIFTSDALFFSSVFVLLISCYGVAGVVLILERKLASH